DDVNPAGCKQAEDLGVTIATDARAVAAESDFVIVVVGFDSEAERVVMGADGIAAAARPGLIVGIASTIAPRTMLKLGRHLADTGITLIDMPLTRGEPAARAGTSLVRGGASAQRVAACKRAMESFASDIFHVGALGAGQVGKMVNNLILWACMSANHEGFRLAEQLGVDPEQLRPALLESSAGNWAMKTRPERWP